MQTTSPKHRSHSPEESRLTAGQIKLLLALLGQPIPDLEGARKLLSNIKSLTLNSADFSPRILHNFWLTIRGNISLHKIYWETEQKEHDESAALREIINHMVAVNEKTGEFSTAGRRADISAKAYKTAENHQFKSYFFEPVPLDSLLFVYKLRVNFSGEMYPHIYDEVATIICQLNYKYAFDLYTPPLQSFKRTCINEEYAAVVKIYETLLSDEANQEEICKNLLLKIKDSKMQKWLVYIIDSVRDKDLLTKYLQHPKSVLTSYERMVDQAQFTLYPCSDHNPRDISLFFLIRDLEIILEQRGFQPSTSFAETDLPIGRYVSFRQHLSEERAYVSYNQEEKQLQQLGAAQLASPAFLFLSNQTYTEFYCQLLNPKTPEGIVKLLQHYLAEQVDDTTKPLFQQLITQITTTTMSISNILQAFDMLLLSLHVNVLRIDDQLIGISRCLDKVFARERIALLMNKQIAVPSSAALTEASLLAASYTKPGGILASTSAEPTVPQNTPTTSHRGPA